MAEFAGAITEISRTRSGGRVRLDFLLEGRIAVIGWGLPQVANGESPRTACGAWGGGSAGILPAHPSPTPTKLTTAQRELLSSAMARKGRVVIPSATLTGAAADRMAGKLLKLGLVQEIEARGTMPVWRKEGERGLALKLTPAGVTAIEAAEIRAEPVAAARASVPRADSKIARVIERLAAPDGATLADLATMTGWLPHTTRAALTGLRRRGFTLERESDTNGPSVYRIRGTPQAVGPAE